jgi:hypothetical protein
MLTQMKYILFSSTKHTIFVSQGTNLQSLDDPTLIIKIQMKQHYTIQIKLTMNQTLYPIKCL